MSCSPTQGWAKPSSAGRGGNDRPLMIGQAISHRILTRAVFSPGAIGVSPSLQILRFANFSHSELVTWGAYLALGFVAVAGAGTDPSARAVLLRLAVPGGLGARRAWHQPGCARRRSPGVPTPAPAPRAPAHHGVRELRGGIGVAQPGAARLGAGCALLHGRAAIRPRGAARCPAPP